MPRPLRSGFPRTRARALAAGLRARRAAGPLEETREPFPLALKLLLALGLLSLTATTGFFLFFFLDLIGP